MPRTCEGRGGPHYSKTAMSYDSRLLTSGTARYKGFDFKSSSTARVVTSLKPSNVVTFSSVHLKFAGDELSGFVIATVR
jgi:hypothetical protein